MPDALRSLLTVLVLVGGSSVAAGEAGILREESKRLYREVPDVAISLPRGEQVRLSELWDDKPVLLTLFYNRCTGSCSPFLRSLKSAVERVGGLGVDYRVVSLSFDPADTPAEVEAMANALHIAEPREWLVGTASPEDVKRLADAIGFSFQRIPATDQFDHPSLIAAVSRGRVVRVLLGNTVSKPRFRELVLESRGIFLPFYVDPDDDTRFRCLDVDEAGELRLSWGLLVLVVPGLLTLAMAGLVFRRPRRDAAREEETPPC